MYFYYIIQKQKKSICFLSFHNKIGASAKADAPINISNYFATEVMWVLTPSYQ